MSSAPQPAGDPNGLPQVTHTPELELSNQKNWTIAMLVMGVSFGVIGGFFLATRFAPGAAYLPNSWVGHTITWMQHNSALMGIVAGGGSLVALGVSGWGFREFRVLKASQQAEKNS